jgi:hypothetical protein
MSYTPTPAGLSAFYPRQPAAIIGTELVFSIPEKLSTLDARPSLGRFPFSVDCLSNSSKDSNVVFLELDLEAFYFCKKSKALFVLPTTCRTAKHSL